jgi:hypothetical protein
LTATTKGQTATIDKENDAKSKAKQIKSKSKRVLFDRSVTHILLLGVATTPGEEKEFSELAFWQKVGSKKNVNLQVSRRQKKGIQELCGGSIFYVCPNIVFRTTGFSV